MLPLSPPTTAQLRTISPTGKVNLHIKGRARPQPRDRSPARPWRTLSLATNNTDNAPTTRWLRIARMRVTQAQRIWLPIAGTRETEAQRIWLPIAGTRVTQAQRIRLPIAGTRVTQAQRIRLP